MGWRDLFQNQLSSQDPRPPPPPDQRGGGDEDGGDHRAERGRGGKAWRGGSCCKDRSSRR